MMTDATRGMMRARWERLLVCATALGIAAMTIPPAGAATIPDFSGFWGRHAFNFEPLPTGPKPVTNLERLLDGTANRTLQVGDYTNPILKPGAAKAIKQLGEEARSGDAHDDGRFRRPLRRRYAGHRHGWHCRRAQTHPHD